MNDMGLVWRKASASGGGNCVEAAPLWRTASGSAGENCVQVASVDGVAVRDSKHPTAHLKLTPGQFGRLLNHLKAGNR